MAISNCENPFFTNIEKKLNNEINLPRDKSFKDHLKNKYNLQLTFKIIYEENEGELINELSSKTSFGFDDISSKFLKSIKTAVTIIIKQMINMGIFPDKLKIAEKMLKLNLLIIDQYLFYLQYLKYLKELYSISYITSFLIINYFMVVNMDSGKDTLLDMLHWN